MRRAWYVWKFYRGRYVGCIRVPQGFDAADRLAVRLFDSYRQHDWNYQVADTKGPPPAKFVDAGMGI